MSINTDTIIANYVSLRDKRSALSKKFKELDDEIKEKMDKLEGHLLKRLNDAGSDSFKTESGTAYVQVKKKVSCADWNGFWQWVIDNRRADMLEKRVSSAAVKEYEEEHNAIPPYLNVLTEREVVVRRA